MRAHPPVGWEARRAWGDLGSAVQREVVAAAERGEAHPDAGVRGVAVRWSQWLLRPSLWVMFVLVGVVAGAAFTLLAVAVGLNVPPLAPYGLGALLALVSAWRQRRLARRVWDANAS